MGEYNRSNSLTIDPVLRYSSFLGGGLADSGIAVAVDSSRNTYYMGVTSSLDFPVLGGVKDTGQPEDIFVTKVSSNGKSLVYSTYLGGTGTDTISVDRWSGRRRLGECLCLWHHQFKRLSRCEPD